MKKTNLLAILTLAATPAFLHAQVTSYSEIVGYQSVSVPTGASTLGLPFLNPDLVKTSATGISGTILTLSGESNVGSRLTTGLPYYVEVYSGNLKGERFDIDTAATINSGNGTVTLSSSSANNTFPVASISTNLDGSIIALRQHTTLDQIRTSASPSLVGANSPTSADQIQFYNTATRSFSTYYLRSDGINWRLSGATTNGFNNVVVPPGVGVFVQKRTSGSTLTTAGLVRQNDFSRPYQAGLQLLAMPYPLDSSAPGFGASGTGGWTGNNTPTSADQIQIYNPGSRSFTTFYLRGDGLNWRRSGSTTNEASNFQMLNAGNAFFALRRIADSNNIIVNPIAN